MDTFEKFSLYNYYVVQKLNTIFKMHSKEEKFTIIAIQYTANTFYIAYFQNLNRHYMKPSVQSYQNKIGQHYQSVLCLI